MFEPIEKLLILQERDRKILHIEEELSHVPVERQQLQSKSSVASTTLEAARLKVKQLETERKKLELDVESKKELIGKYSLQQFQTRKNEEYRALSHEIETCKGDIGGLEDRELELMEAIDGAQKEVAAATKVATEVKRDIDSLLAGLNQREQALKKDLAELQINRDQLAGAVEDELRQRYQRLFKQKGNNVVVGVNHGVCNGCHMQLSRQIVVSCQASQEVMYCPNCGRILYYSSDMDVSVSE
jgi:uncharacterized protein